MDTKSFSADDLSDLEKRLRGWQPAVAGLDAEAMLFAAGRASARGWRMWAGATGLLAVLAVALGVVLQGERAERLALARQLAQRDRLPEPPHPPVTSDPPAEGYLRLRDLVLEKGIDAWSEVPIERLGPSKPIEAPRILRAGSRDQWIEQ